MKSNSKHSNILQFETFQFDCLFHFTTTIHGGVSKGNYESFNLGNISDDNPDHVIENRKRLANIADIEYRNLIIPKQTHSSNVRIIDSDFINLNDTQRASALNEVDALITQCTNICLGITTADCVPILLFDPIRKVLGVAHAGWKGTVARIGQKTAELMSQQFHCDPQDILVGIGPSISPKCFEVGEEVGQSFIDAKFNLDKFSFRKKETGKLHIDLWEANKIQLIEIGIKIENIEIANLCTKSSPDLFFSARRQSINSGRILTGGVIRENR